MAVIYLRSTDGSDASDGLTWANAKATLASALTAAGAGGTVYASDNHAESQAGTMTLTSPGTAASPVLVLCVSDAGDPEPPTSLATTATVTISNSAAMNFNGVAYCYGITFANASTSFAPFNFSSSSHWWWRFEACKFNFTASSGSVNFTVGTNSTSVQTQLLELINTTFTFGAVGQGINVQCPFVWTNTPSAISGTAPTTLFKGPSGIGGSVILRGVDLSALGSGKNLIAVNNNTFTPFHLENCKLGSSVSLTTGSVTGQGGQSARLVNCDSADTNYRYHKQTYQGTITQETTIVRSSGASDGTTPVSRKMVTTANAKFYSPLDSDPCVFWNETTGSSVTATVEVVTDGVTLTDAEAWLEVEYLGTSGFPVASFASDRAADILATGANQTTSSVTWTTTGLSSPTKQKLSVSFTPQEKGPVRCRVMLSRASTTMYFCPKVDVS